jgi:hypothetical protein
MSIKDDPRFQAIVADLTEAAPILMGMAADHRDAVLEMLATKGQREEALLQLRQAAMPDQWESFRQSAIARGDADCLKAVADRDYLLALAFKLAFDVLAGAVVLI